MSSPCSPGSRGSSPRLAAQAGVLSSRRFPCVGSWHSFPPAALLCPYYVHRNAEALGGSRSDVQLRQPVPIVWGLCAHSPGPHVPVSGLQVRKDGLGAQQEPPKPHCCSTDGSEDR